MQTLFIISASARPPLPYHPAASVSPPGSVKRYLYVAVPGIRDYMGYGGHGIQDMPGWITFSIDGKYVCPSSGEVIDVKTRKILTTLKVEFYNSAAREKMVEIDFAGNKAVKANDQFGIGQIRK